MTFVSIVLSSLLILNGLAGKSLVNGQGANRALVPLPIVHSSLGQQAKLQCSIPKDESETLPPNKLRYCVWERLHQERSANPFIVNFNEINSQPGLYSGTRGYSYTGEGFRVGDCGVKVSFVKVEDFAKWQCTLITDDKIYRGYASLERETPTTTTTQKPKLETYPDQDQTVAVAFSRTAIDDDKGGKDNDDLNRPRPIITSYNDARAIIQPEIIIHSTSGEGGTHPIQEVKVESAGLQIKPRRQGKLIVFE